MNWLETEQLLERFWKGETSLAEEQKLKNAFSRDDVPSHLVAFKGYFTFMTEQRLIENPQKDFEEKLSQKLNAKKIRSLTLPKLPAYAAGLLILMSSLFFLLKNEKVDETKYKPLTTREIQVAQKYMNLMARNMEQSISLSTQNLEKFDLLNIGSQTIQQYENTYNKQLKNLNRIEYIDRSINQLKYLKTFANSKNKL